MFLENPSSGSELFHVDGWAAGQTDRQDEGNSRFSQFYKTISKAK